MHTLGEPGRKRHPLSRPRQAHQIGLWLEGNGRATVGGVPLPEYRPAAWFVPAGDEATWELEGRQDVWSVSFDWHVLDVSPEGDELVLRWQGLNRRVPRVKCADVGDASRMVDVYRLLRDARARAELGGAFEVQSYLFCLIAFYVDLAESDETAGHRALLRFRQLLEARAFEDLNIEDLAAEVGMSSEHIRNLFYKRYGYRPHGYRVELRMARARELLCTSDFIVKEIASQVGYNDALYFSRVFKSHFGVSPSEMIRRHRDR